MLFCFKKSHFYKFLALALLTHFAVSGTFLTAHTISHQLKLKNEISFNGDLKNNFSSSDKELNSCDFCSLFALQNQAISFTPIALAISAFYLAAIFFIKDKVKLSFLLFSNYSRAPPIFS